MLPLFLLRRRRKAMDLNTVPHPLEDQSKVAYIRPGSLKMLNQFAEHALFLRTPRVRSHVSMMQSLAFLQIVSLSTPLKVVLSKRRLLSNQRRLKSNQVSGPGMAWSRCLRLIYLAQHGKCDMVQPWLYVRSVRHRGNAEA